jgi:hypothetical protein
LNPVARNTALRAERCPRFHERGGPSLNLNCPFGRRGPQAIAAELYERAIAAVQNKVHHCQMAPNTPPQLWDRGHGRVTRDYTMYERAED